MSSGWLYISEMTHTVLLGLLNYAIFISLCLLLEMCAIQFTVVCYYML